MTMPDALLLSADFDLPLAGSPLTYEAALRRAGYALLESLEQVDLPDPALTAVHAARATDLATDEAVQVVIFAQTGSESVRQRAIDVADRLYATPSLHVVRIRVWLPLDDAIVVVTDVIPSLSVRRLVAERGPLPVPQIQTLLVGLARGVRTVHQADLWVSGMSVDTAVLGHQNCPLVSRVGWQALRQPTSEPARVSEGQAQDVYDLAVLGVCAATGELPDPQAPPGDRAHPLHLLQHHPLLHPSLVPAAMIDLWQQALAPEQHQRPTAHDFAVEMARLGPPQPIEVPGTRVDALPRPASGSAAGADTLIATPGHAEVAPPLDKSLPDPEACVEPAPEVCASAAAVPTPPVQAHSRRSRPGRTRRHIATPRRRWGRTLLVAVVVVTVLAGGGLGLWWWLSRVESTPAAPTSAALASPSNVSAAPSGPAPEVGPAEWVQVLDILSARRERLLATGDLTLLEAMDVKNSPSYRGDLATVRALNANQRRVVGAHETLLKVAVVAPLSGLDRASQVQLEVTDTMPELMVTDLAGRPLSSVPAREARTWRVTLRKVGGAWRSFDATRWDPATNRSWYIDHPQDRPRPLPEPTASSVVSR